MTSRIHPKRRDAIILLNEAGWTDVEIGHALNAKSSSIWRYRTRFGLDTVPSKYRPKIVHDEALELYEMGLSDSEIARKFGASRSAISVWRKRNGLERNNEILPPPTPDVQKQIKKMLVAGASRAKISEKFGVSVAYLSRFRGKMKQDGLRKRGMTDASIRAKLRADRTLMPRLNKAIGGNVPLHIREHAVHDMYCDLFDCVLSLDQIEKRAPSYRSAAFKMCGDTWSHSRLDEEDENGLSLMDTLTNDEWDPQEGW